MDYESSFVPMDPDVLTAACDNLKARIDEYRKKQDLQYIEWWKQNRKNSRWYKILRLFGADIRYKFTDDSDAVEWIREEEDKRSKNSMWYIKIFPCKKDCARYRLANTLSRMSKVARSTGDKVLVSYDDFDTIKDFLA